MAFKPSGNAGNRGTCFLDSEHTSQLCCEDVFSGHSDAVLQ
jgi:hypothetical protein